MISRTLAAALKESRKKAGEAFAKLAGDVSKAGSAAARRIVDSYAKVVLPLAQKYEAIAKSLKAAQDKLAKLRDDAKQYAADAKRSVVEGSKLGEQESVGGIVNSLRESISYAQQFAANLAKIRPSARTRPPSSSSLRPDPSRDSSWVSSSPRPARAVSPRSPDCRRSSTLRRTPSARAPPTACTRRASPQPRAW